LHRSAHVECCGMSQRLGSRQTFADTDKAIAAILYDEHNK
jgi:hypothetical protein